jgi:hypothetical protein
LSNIFGGKRSKKYRCEAMVKEINIDCRVLVRKPQRTESRRKYRPRHDNVKIGLKRETCCWGGETIIAKLVCG